MKVLPEKIETAGRKGSILVVVLWLVTIMSMLAVSITAFSSGQIIFTRNLRNRAACYYLARAGIIMGIAELERNQTLSPNFDALKDEWSNKAEIFANRTLRSGTFSVTYEYASGLKVYNTMEGDKAITNTFYGMIDEDRKLNINAQTRPDYIKNLFQQVAVLQEDQAKALADCIMDWRDQDSIRRQYGAEAEHYENLPNSYKCKNNKFDTLEELILVKGMTPEIFNAVKDYITIYGDSRANINTAPYNVLITLGLTASAADAVIRARAGVDEAEGTEDDEVFTQPNAITNIVGKRTSLSQSDSDSITKLVNAGMLKVSSDYFKIISIGSLSGDEGGKKNSAKITCIAHKNSGKIVYWQE